MKYIGSVGFISIANDNVIKRIKEREHIFHPSFKLNRETTGITLSKLQISSNKECVFLVNNNDEVIVNGVYQGSELLKISKMICKTAGVDINIIYEYGDEEITPSKLNTEDCSCENGATFTPSVSIDGDLSWKNDKNLPNPQAVNIKGEEGESAYDIAVNNGFIGSEVDWLNSLKPISGGSAGEILWEGWSKEEIDLGVAIADYEFIEIYANVSDNYSPNFSQKFLAKQEGLQQQLFTVYFHGGNGRIYVALKGIIFSGTKIAKMAGSAWHMDLPSQGAIGYREFDAIAITRVVGFK